MYSSCAVSRAHVAQSPFSIVECLDYRRVTHFPRRSAPGTAVNFSPLTDRDGVLFVVVFFFCFPRLIRDRRIDLSTTNSLALFGAPLFVQRRSVHSARCTPARGRDTSRALADLFISFFSLSISIGSIIDPGPRRALRFIRRSQRPIGSHPISSSRSYFIVTFFFFNIKQTEERARRVCFVSRARALGL